MIGKRYSQVFHVNRLIEQIETLRHRLFSEIFPLFVIKKRRRVIIKEILYTIHQARLYKAIYFYLRQTL